MSSKEVAILVMYYAFTTLSTVGFGDYYPSSELEKVLSVPVMMFGVSVFSFVMGSFQEILLISYSINDDLEEGDKLDKFMGVLAKYNGDVQIS